MWISSFVIATALFIIIGFLWYVLDNLYYSTNKSTIKKIGKIIIARGAQSCLLYDVGSSRGNFLFGILDRCPHLRTVGIDNSSVRTLTARLRGCLRVNKPKFLKADIFDIDVSKADIVFAYLPSPMLPALQAKLRKDLKPGAIAITSRVYFPSWKPAETFLKSSPKEEDIYIYEKV